MVTDAVLAYRHAKILVGVCTVFLLATLAVYLATGTIIYPITDWRDPLYVLSIFSAIVILGISVQFTLTYLTRSLRKMPVDLTSDTKSETRQGKKIN